MLSFLAPTIFISNFLKDLTLNTLKLLFLGLNKHVYTTDMLTENRFIILLQTDFIKQRLYEFMGEYMKIFHQAT